MTPQDEFITAQLRLVPVSHDHAEALYRLGTNADVLRYLLFAPNDGIGATHDFISRCRTAWASGSAFTYALLPKDSGPVMGTLELRLQGARIELGYVLDKPYWGKGYVAEAVSALSEWSLAQEGIHRVQAYCSCENIGSQRVLEKSGFTREGRLAKFVALPNKGGEVADHFIYGKTR